MKNRDAIIRRCVGRGPARLVAASSVLALVGASGAAFADGYAAAGADSVDALVVNADSDGDGPGLFAVVVGADYGYNDTGDPGTGAQLRITPSEVFLNRNTSIVAGGVSGTGSLSVAGATTLSSTLGVTGAATLNSTLDAKGAISNSTGVLTVNDAMKTTNSGGANLVVNEVSGNASLTSTSSGHGLTISGTTSTVLKGGTNSGILTLQDGDATGGGTPNGTSLTISGSGGGAAATVLQTATNAGTTLVTTAIGTSAVYSAGSTATLQAGPTNAVTVNSGNADAAPGVSVKGVVGPGSTSLTGVLITGDGQNGASYTVGSGATPSWADVAIQSKSFGLGDPTLGSAILITDHGVQIISPQPSNGQQITNNTGGLNLDTGGTITNNYGMNSSSSSGTATNNIGGVSGNGTVTNGFGNNTSSTGGAASNSIGMNSGNGAVNNSFGGGSGSGPTSNTIGQNTGAGTVTNGIGNANTVAGVVTNNTIGVNNGAGSVSNGVGNNTSNGTAANSFGVNSGSGSATNAFGNNTSSGSATNSFGQNSGSGNVNNGFGNSTVGSTGNATNLIGQNNGTGVMTNGFGGGTGASTNNIGVGDGLATNNIGTGPGQSINAIGSATLGSTITSRAGNANSFMANGVSTTSVSAGGGVGGSVLALAGTTRGDSAIVLKDATANHVVVDANGKLGAVTAAPVQQTSAAMTVTNGLGNTHGFYVNEQQATMSGGTRSSSLTLNDNGATFSNSNTGAPIRVHGVDDGRAAYDAVNVRQLYGGVAAAMATAPTVNLAPGEIGVGIGSGHYGGYTALGVSLGYQAYNGAQFNIGVAQGLQGGSETAVRVGLGFKW